MVSIKHKVTIKKKVPQGPDPLPPKKKKKNDSGKVIGGIAVLAVFIIVCFFFANKENGNSNNNTTTEVVAQNKESHENHGDGSAAGTSTKEANANEVAKSAKTSERSAPANAESPTSEEPVTTPATANDNDAAEAAKHARSKHTTGQSAKPSTVTTASAKGNVEENARRVIRGEFGNGQERKDKLGSSYSEIQGKVNEMYRQNLVH